ncbi:MAG: hypothetical protein C0404_14025 [Verrucomicrobia bacterium]|nr:hypothetical protein [Verrucomicrobiota bacterium]
MTTRTADSRYGDQSRGGSVVQRRVTADERRINSKEELRRFFQFADQFHADELPTKAGLDKLDKERFSAFLRDRIEIVSSGHLPNNLTIEKTRVGNSNIRNPILASYAAKGMLPYHGIGSGITRALDDWPDIRFTDVRGGT